MSVISALLVTIPFYLDYQINQGRCDVVSTVSQKPLLGCLTLDPNGNCVNCANGFKATSTGKCAVGIKNC